jgi:acyl-CoA synthetase (AMP-forming)/AMP-acid ligase II
VAHGDLPVIPFESAEYEQTIGADGEDPMSVGVVVAFVVADVDPVERDRLCLDRIAGFKRPEDYLLVSRLPKNNTGKVLKTELGQWDRANLSASEEVR